MYRENNLEEANKIKKIKKILWAYDGSRESEEAFNITKYFAGLYGSDIYGIYVNTPLYYPISPNFMYYAGYIKEASNKKKILIENKFKKLKNQLSKSRINFYGKIVKGEIDDEIKKFSKSKKTDLISIGNSGKDFISRTILGSNTLKILRKSERPVLTVPNTKRSGKYKVEKILLPVDISEKNYKSLECAIDIANKTGAHISIIYILSIPHNINEIPPNVMDEIVEGSNRELLDLLAKSRGKNKKLSISKKLIINLSPSTTILEYAKKNNFNLLVMNSHNKRNLERFFLGSVAEEVIRGSSCPVLTIRPGY